MDRILFEKNVILKSDSQAAFFGRIQKRICDLISYGFLTTKKNGRSDKGSFTMTTECPRADSIYVQKT